MVTLTTINSLAKEREAPRLPFSDVLGAARLSELRSEYATRGGKVTARMLERSKSAALSSPLSAEPFLFAALRFFPHKESMGESDAEPFLREVLRRDPRSRAAHLLLLRRAVADENIDMALFHLSRLKQLEPDMVSQLMRSLGAQVRSTVAAEEVARALSSHPDLIDGITEGIANGGASAEVIASFARNLPPAARVSSTAIPGLINRLVKDGYVLEARSLWAQSNGISTERYAGPIYDPAFAEEGARPPFGWTYNENDSGVAEWRGPHAVYIEYYGRHSGVLLSQTIALKPGHYRVAAAVSPQDSNSDSIALQISCIGGAPMLAQATIGSEVSSSAPLEIEFDVPRACAGQTISLVGLPTESRVGGAIMLHRITASSTTGTL